MHYDLMNIVWRADVPRHLKLVLIKLTFHADEYGENAFPSVRRIALECGLKERAVRGALSQLRELGYIERMRFEDPVRKLPAVYRILVRNLPMLPMSAPAISARDLLEVSP